MFKTGLITVGYILLASILFSCENNIIEPSSDLTFGIRHDIPLTEYESLATRSSSDLPNFSAVVFFGYSLNGKDKQQYTASGTLIDEEWILTAGHNFYDAQEQNNPAPPEGITVKLGNDPNSPDMTYEVAEIVFHPTWLAGDQEYKDANDLCLVKLASPMTHITPVPLYTSDDEAVGSQVWFCGFGDYTRLLGQDPDLDSKKHAIKNILDRKNTGLETAAGGQTYNGGLLAFDFDDPEALINSLGDDLVSQDEETLGSGNSMAGALDYEGTTVQGDSGGPLFVNKDGVWQLAGVLAGGASEPIEGHSDGSYGDISIFTRVSTASSWIQSVIK